MIKFFRLDPPELTSNPAVRVTVNKYDILRLSCIATGNELPWFKWYKNGFLLLSGVTFTNTDKQPDSTSTTSSLKVTRVDTSHAGVYLCQATNTLGEARSVTKVDVVCEFLNFNFLLLLTLLYCASWGGG